MLYSKEELDLMLDAKHRFDGDRNLRERLGCHTNDQGSAHYVATLDSYVRAVVKHRNDIPADLAFEADCAKSFAANTEAGEPRYRLFGVKTSDPESPEYKAGLQKFIRLERKQIEDAKSHAIRTPEAAPGGASQNDTALDTAMAKAEKDARVRFATDARARANYGIPDNYCPDPESPQYQDALRRYVQGCRRLVRDNWKSSGTSGK